MFRPTCHFYLLLLNIFTVISQIESNSTKLLSKSKEKVSLKDVPGYSLTKDEMKKFNIWADGFIPYYIDVTSFSDKVLRDKIRSYLNTVNNIAPLNFVELPSPPEDDTTRWVFFINRRGLLGCADHSVWNFTFEGVQRVVLGYDCMNKDGELPEAVLAIAGVPSQHTAPNRDDYIEVFVDNVIPDKRKLFDKLTDSDWLFHDLPYDYDSVGHYHNFKYSMNGKTVIQPRNPDITIGETKELSEIDILKIRLLYNFMAQKKRLDVPDCQKLFKTGSKFKSFVPFQINVKPKRKPVKYIQLQKSNSVEYIDDKKALSEEQSKDKESIEDEEHENDEDKVTDNYQEELSTEKTDGKPVIINLPESTKDSNEILKIETKTIQKMKSVKKNEPLKYKQIQKKKKKIIKKKKLNDVLSKLPDYHSGQIKYLNLEIKDPLEYLSDSEGDEAEDRKGRIDKEKHETLKYINEIHNE